MCIKDLIFIKLYWNFQQNWNQLKQFFTQLDVLAVSEEIVTDQLAKYIKNCSIVVTSGLYDQKEIITEQTKTTRENLYEHF